VRTADLAARGPGQGFAPATREDWLRLVEKTLAGRPFETLVSRTIDGLALGPVSAPALGARPIVGRGPGLAWSIVQRVDHPDPAAANALALADLENGATGLSLVLPEAPAAYGAGLGAYDVADLDRTLQGVHLEFLDLSLEAGANGAAAAALFAALCKARGLEPASLRVCFGLDPLGAAAASGKPSAAWEGVAQSHGGMARAMAERGFAGPFFLADGRPYHAAGASEAQELAAALSAALAYLRVLDAAGLDLAQALKGVAFKLVADSDQFLTIAKFRAARLLWAKVVSELGAPGTPVRVEAETAWRELARRDPWVNVLRGTAAAMAAGLAGADAVTVLPFTQALGLPDAFARRLARNAQLILMEECHLHRVADPAAGSGALEKLTRDLAELSWTLFQDLERHGGMAKALESGHLQRMIAGTRSARDELVATGRQGLVGVTVFPSRSDAPVEVLRAKAAERPAASRPPLAAPSGEGFEALLAAAEAGATLSDLAQKGGGARSFEALPATRLAEPFEHLRDRADAIRAAQGFGAKVFLAKLGALPEHRLRAEFARSLFEVGRLDVVEDEVADPDAGGRALIASGARVACLCGPDALYGVMAADLVAALRRAGASRVYVAGRPAPAQETMTPRGVSGYVFEGCNILRVLLAAIEAAAQDPV